MAQVSFLSLFPKKSIVSTKIIEHSSSSTAGRTNSSGQIFLAELQVGRKTGDGIGEKSKDGEFVVAVVVAAVVVVVVLYSMFSDETEKHLDVVVVVTTLFVKLGLCCLLLLLLLLLFIFF